MHLNLLVRRFAMKKILIFLLLLIALVPLQAGARQWRLDPVHTNFYFEVKHTYAAVRGQFMEFTGDVFFDPDNPSTGRFDFVIDVNSIDTKVGKRDTHLRSADFFDAGRYPQMTFKSNRVSHAGGNRYNVEGVLTIKDVSRDIVLEFVYHGQKDNPVKPGETITGMDVRLTIDRLAYNVGDGRFYKIGVVDKDVDILVTLEMLR